MKEKCSLYYEESFVGLDDDIGNHIRNLFALYIKDYIFYMEWKLFF